MNKKILFIDSWDNIGQTFRQERNRVKNVNSVSLYKNNSILNKIIRLIGLKIYAPFIYFAYGKWKKQIANYDVFILESRRTFEYAIKYIKKNTKDKRIIIWYWNEVTEREMKPQTVIEKYNCEAWTFDKKNAEKYHMNYNDTYYFSTIKLPNNKIENEVFYVGIDREGRIGELKKIANILNTNNLKYNFNLTISPIKKREKGYNYKERLEYKEVIDEISKTKAILDLTKKTQYGLTLRPMEAIFFNKKLITDNKNILEYKFYNKKNIFIIGYDDFEGIKDFLNSEYEEIDKNIINEYDFENWISRIIEKGEKNV